MAIDAEISRAAALGEELEGLVTGRGQINLGDGLSVERGRLLAAFWALVFDFHKGILALLGLQYFSSAFALARPLDEALLKAHLVIVLPDEKFAELAVDRYSPRFQKEVPKIDLQFGYDGLLTRAFDGKAMSALHSFTHSGLSQTARRFIEGDLGANFTQGEINELIRHTCSAAFMVTTLLTKRCRLDAEARAAEEKYIAWSRATQTTVT